MARTTDARTYGIEIELVGLTRTRAEEVLIAAGINASSAYSHNARANAGAWVVKPDGSLRNDKGTGTCEVVSPILTGREGFAQIRKVMLALYAAGGRANESCGLHVHLGAEDLKVKHLKALALTYMAREREISALLHPRRREGGTNTYCRPLASIINMRLLREATGRQALRSAFASRYTTVNMHALAAHGTVEFRQHQGCMDPEKAIRWVQLCQAMVRRAVATGEAAAPITADTLNDRLVTLLRETCEGDAALMNFWLRRAAAVNKGEVQAPGGWAR